MKRFPLFVAACAALAPMVRAHAANWADAIVSYSAGNTYLAPDPGVSFTPPAGAVNVSYTSPSAADFGGITGDTGWGVLTPFNGAYSTDQMAGIGAGGSIVLQFADPVRTSGYTIGIHTGSMLADQQYPDGYAGATATPLSTPRRATIAVSAHNAGDADWYTLGTFDLNNPSNYYATGVDTPGSQMAVTAGTLADVTKPFTGSGSSFDGAYWTQMLATLDGSAGGNWIDLSSAGLSSVSYVRFTVPTGSVLYLDAVVGLPAPEPASLSLLALGGLMLLRRRRTAR